MTSANGGKVVSQHPPIDKLPRSSVDSSAGQLLAGLQRENYLNGLHGVSRERVTASQTLALLSTVRCLGPGVHFLG